MNQQELQYVGRNYLFWIDQKAIDDNEPLVARCYRCTIVNGIVYFHGDVRDRNGFNTIGDPWLFGYDPGFAVARVVQSPELGQVTLVTDTAPSLIVTQPIETQPDETPPDEPIEKIE